MVQVARGWCRSKMTRKDSEKDSERPHYYSQFWLDVAAGRRIIGAPRPEDEAAELETPEPAPPLHRGGRSIMEDSSDSRVAADGRSERIVHPVAEPLATPEEFIEPEEEEIDLATDNVDELDMQDAVVDDTDIPDMDLGPAEEEEEEEKEEEDDLFDEEEEEEEEDDDIGWGGARSRKRNKPVRPKLPPKKAPGRREPRRGY